MTRLDIVSKAREYVGTPFHHLGRLKGVGVDCYGLIFCVVRDLGSAIPDFRYSHRQNTDKHIRAALTTLGMSDGQGLLGDIAVLWIRDRSKLSHLCWLTGKTIIHACDRTGRVIEVGFSEHWQERVALTKIPIGLEES